MATNNPADGTPGRGVLLLSCQDRQGIVAAVAGFIAEHGGNIVHAEQHTDFEARIFFQRVEFELAGLSIPRDEIAVAFQPIATRFAMTVNTCFTDDIQRVGVLVSRTRTVFRICCIDGAVENLPLRCRLSSATIPTMRSSPSSMAPSMCTSR